MTKKKAEKQEKIKLNVVLYFLLGFIFNILGLVGGLIWMKFNVKIYRKKKIIALLAGFSAYVLYTFILTPFVLQPLLQPKIDQSFFKEHPDAGRVTQVIQQKYPDAKIFVRIDQNTTSFNGKTTTTKVFSVQHRSTKQLLTSKQMQNIAKQTCSIIKSSGTKYDKVLILSLKYTLPLEIAEIHWGIRESCKDWETKDYSNVTYP